VLKIRSGNSLRGTLLEKGLADKGWTAPEGDYRDSSATASKISSVLNVSPSFHGLDFTIVASLDFGEQSGGGRMSGCRGTIIVVTLSLFQLVGMANLHAADGPATFDCGKDRTALAVTVCSDEATMAAERRATASYLAAYYGLPETRRPSFRSDHTQWLNALTNRCSRPPSLRQANQPPLSIECVRRLYTQRGDVYREKLAGLALEESDLSPALLKKIQKRLVELHFLSGEADGIFGANTRTAIKDYQTSIDHVQSNFLSAEERNMLLELTQQAQGSQPNEAPAHEPVAEAETANQMDTQTLQSLDNRPLQPYTADRAIEQTAKQSAPDAVSSSAKVDVVAPIDRGNRTRTRYFIEGGAIAAIIFVLAIDSVLVKLRRRMKSASKGGDAGNDIPGVSLKTDTLRIKPTMQGRQARVVSSLKAASSNLDNAGNATTAVQRDARRA
jgi:Putative peptidoglycan binding domain